LLHGGRAPGLLEAHRIRVNRVPPGRGPFDHGTRSIGVDAAALDGQETGGFELLNTVGGRQYLRGRDQHARAEVVQRPVWLADQQTARTLGRALLGLGSYDPGVDGNDDQADQSGNRERLQEGVKNHSKEADNI
jgi:hypothetical protein